MLTCKELTEIITDYMEGRLTFMERMKFRMHVGMCSHCRTYLKQMKQTVRIVGKLSEESIPPETREELLRRFRNWKR